MQSSDAHVALRIGTFGDNGTRQDWRSPTLTLDGQIALAVEDGQMIADVPAQSVDHSVVTLNNTDDITELLQAMGSPKQLVLQHGLAVMITDARVIFVMDKLEAPGSRIIGHLRYPWIQSVEFRPRQSFFNDAVLRFQFVENFPIADHGSWLHSIELTFKKSFHPGPIGLEIAQRASAYNLAHGAPSLAGDRLRAMTTTAALADPPKGDLSMYVMPAFVPLPGGAGPERVGVPVIDWTVTGE